MIYAAIFHITQQLNQHLKRSFDLNEDIVVLANIVEQDGTVAAHVNNRIVASLINIEKDASAGGRPPTNRTPDPSAMVTPPLHTNLYLLFAGNFNAKNYGESLKFLSNTIAYFQRHPFFTHQNSPELDPSIAKLSLDIENLSIRDLSSLWSVLSGKYLPSVLYKVRMITFDGQSVMSRRPRIADPGAAVTP